MPTRSLNEVLDAGDNQIPPEFPCGMWFDTLTGQRLRRQYLCSCSGAQLLIGGVGRSTGVDLCFGRTATPASRAGVNSTPTCAALSTNAGSGCACR